MCQAALCFFYAFFFFFFFFLSFSKAHLPSRTITSKGLRVISMLLSTLMSSPIRPRSVRWSLNELRKATLHFTPGGTSRISRRLLCRGFSSSSELRRIHRIAAGRFHSSEYDSAPTFAECSSEELVSNGADTIGYLRFCFAGMFAGEFDSGLQGADWQCGSQKNVRKFHILIRTLLAN